MTRILFAFLLMLAFAGPLQAQDQPPDVAKLEQAAGSGDGSAAMSLGDAFRLGTGVEANATLALSWYERAAALGRYEGYYFAAWHLAKRSQPGDMAKAVDYMSKAAAMCEAGGTALNCNVSLMYRTLAEYQTLLARHADALKSLDKAALAAEALGSVPPIERAYLLRSRATIKNNLGKYQEALDDFQEALTLFTAEKGAESDEVADILFNGGIVLDRMDQPARAIEVYREAARIFEKRYGADNINVVYTRGNIGWALAELKRYDEAYAETAAVLPDFIRLEGANALNTGYILNNLGIIRERQGRHDEAIRLNLRATAIYNRYGEQSLDASRWSYHSLSKSFRAKGKTAMAILMGKLAVNTHQMIHAKNAELSSEVTSSLDTDWQDLYLDLSDMLVEAGRISEAQFVLNLQKRQELIEFVRRDASSGARAGEAALTRHEKQSSAAVERAMEGPVAIAAELDVLTARQASGAASPEELRRIEDLTKQLDRSYEDFVEQVDALLSASASEEGDAQDEITSLNLDYAVDRQEMLKGFTRPTVLLQAASLGETLHLFLTTKDISVHRQVKIARADMAKKVFAVLTAIEERSPEADALLAELYALLISPVEGDLLASKADVVMLNLGGFLRYLPFAALKSERGYLIEDYALVIDTPAARTKFESADRKDAEAAGFGVTAAHEGFSPLPGVARELEAIFEGSDAAGELAGAPILDGAFTADSLKDALKKRPKLLHVASHFKFVPGNETDSFLLLGNGEPLTLEQIRKGRGFRFGGVDLLTLSACETAKGGGADGDEVESFGAIAQMNGASAVMATLWPIADDASGRLMADFYEGLVKDGLDKADALRRAQIAMLRGVPVESVNLATRGATDGEVLEEASAPIPAAVTSRHPYYWSPYILMGNWL